VFAIDHPYAIALIASVIISLSMAVAVLIQKRTLGGYAFALLKTAVGLWAFTSLFEVCAFSLSIKTFAYSAKFFFIVLVPITWFVYGLYYSNRLRKLTYVQIVMLTVIPAISILMVVTNRYHQWMFSSLDVIETAGNQFIMRQFGPWFWIHAGYSYILLFLGFFFMAKHLIDAPTPYRWQVATLLVGGLTPWVANIAFTFQLTPYPYLDLTPFAFTISGVAFMVGIVRFQLLDVAPIAQEVVIENIDDAIIVLDNEQRVLNFNPAAQRLAASSGSKLIGSPAEKVFPWWKLFQIGTDPIPEGSLPIIELHFAHRRRLFRPKILPLECYGRESGHLITLHDITEVMLAREALRSSEERFRSLSENAPVIIFALDPDGTITYLNPAFEKILDINSQKLLGQPFIKWIDHRETELCAHTFDQLIQGKTSVAELNLTFYHKTGAKRLFNISVAANLDSRDQVTGIIGMAKDITEEHELQCQLFQSQKMEAIGTLAGGIAHDFNNLLMGMQANLSLMHLHPSGDPTLKEKIRRIEHQIQTGANLTRQLLGYARKGKYVVTTVDLNNLIQEALAIVERTNKAVSIHYRLSDEPVLIKADQGQMELVLLNLVVNAMDAMPEGGQLRVTTRHIHQSEDFRDKLHNDRCCEITVTDTGIGMDPATQKRIFEPFFTTKEVGQGTGLGLASVYGVIKNHDGDIQVESKEGEGTTFTLLLPTTPESVHQKEDLKECVIPVKGVKILLVEDEPLILKYTREMIQSLGFDVLPARNGIEAIDIYQQQHSHIDLVVLDMIMPEMDGLSVYKALYRINPGLRVLVTSGNTSQSRMEEILSNERNRCLKKPYTRDELAEEITKILKKHQDRTVAQPASFN
jgi:PAS domain S-box-containing protein